MKYIRKINKKGKYSYSLVLPKKIIDSFKWQKKQKVVVKIFGKDKIIISDWKPNKK